MECKQVLIPTEKGVDIAKEIIDEVIRIDRAEKKAKKEKDEMRKQFLSAMTFYGAKNIVNKFLSISKTEEKDELVFDTERFKAENPEMYEKYITKPKHTKASVTFRVK